MSFVQKASIYANLNKAKKYWTHHEQKYVYDVSNFFIYDLYGAFTNAPRSIRESTLRSLINQGLLACLFDSNCNCEGLNLYIIVLRFVISIGYLCLRMLGIHTKKITVILIPYLHCRYGAWRSVVDQLACESKLFLQNILFW